MKHDCITCTNITGFTISLIIIYGILFIFILYKAFPILCVLLSISWFCQKNTSNKHEIDIELLITPTPRYHCVSQDSSWHEWYGMTVQNSCNCMLNPFLRWSSRWWHSRIPGLVSRIIGFTSIISSCQPHKWSFVMGMGSPYNETVIRSLCD